MPRTILVGLDGSEYSWAAVELGIQWAGRFDAMLVGIGIIDEPSICDSSAMPISGSFYKQQADQNQLATARRKVEQVLEQFSIRASEAGVASKQLEDVGDPTRRIILEAQRYDMILLGSKTHFHFATQEGPDEVLHNVVRGGPRPVVAVPLDPAANEPIVVAYDGSTQSARALFMLHASGLAEARPVHVLTLADKHVAAATTADRAVEYLGFHDIKATPHTIASMSHPADTILEQAQQLGAGLLVMGAYGHTTLKEFFFGSTTRRLIAESKVPMLLAR